MLKKQLLRQEMLLRQGMRKAATKKVTDVGVGKRLEVITKQGVQEGVKLFEKAAVKEIEGMVISKGGEVVVEESVNKTMKLLGTARNNLLNTAKHPKLKNIIDDLYRPGAKYGSGSSMDALILEKNLGITIGGKSHHIKLLNYRLALQRIWRTRASLLTTDRKITKQILQDIQNALSNY